ncbi:hypothetical protein EHO61_04600 [Leptospira fluminis]|uniref:Lipoprotein n=1 Tax=Leptospira fluminis TaxID=2484979 RepID=A0A4R9GU81_9LEPT|nr:hypothetical protein [Leptospira fluminis]TGK21137.1 hypothetical protein EHO61_04600 [Leptospira fluminis]
MRTIRDILFLFPIFSVLCCVHKNKTSADYFEKYFQYQEVIQKDFKEGPVRRILYGNPEASDEKEFAEKGDLLVLGMRLTKEQDFFRPNLSDSPPELTVSSPYTVYVEAKKQHFREEPTYKIRRVTQMISPELSVIDLMPHLESFLEHVRNPSVPPLETFSSLQRFLCSNMECDLQRRKDSILLSYTLSERMKKNFPLAYEKFSKRLEQSAFRLQVFQPGGFSEGWEIYNEGKTIRLEIPHSPKGYWSRPHSLHCRFYLFLRVFGLKIDIRGLGYTLHFARNGKTDTVTGKFSKIPETKIGGRFLSIFPPGFVNIFIPGNMEQYFENYFELLVNGSDGKGGSRFVSSTRRAGHKTTVTLTTESEILRERFLPFRGKDEDDSPSFVSEFEKAVVQDIGG